MKYAYLEKDTNKILGWYDKEIHKTIPTPNVEVKDEVWQEAISIAANCYENGKFIVKDFRTPEQIASDELILKKSEGEIYTLNNVDYKVSFMKDDADGLMQVSMAFQLGLTETVIHFENGTKMPIKNTEFEPFAIWFVGKRNSFFVEQLEQGGIDGN